MCCFNGCQAPAAAPTDDTAVSVLGSGPDKLNIGASNAVFHVVAVDVHAGTMHSSDLKV